MHKIKVLVIFKIKISPSFTRPQVILGVYGLHGLHLHRKS